MAHACKHFENRGCGIRLLADTYVYLKHIRQHAFDWQAVWRAFRALEMENFAERIISLTERCFGDGAWSPDAPETAAASIPGFYPHTASSGKSRRFRPLLLLSAPCGSCCPQKHERFRRKNTKCTANPLDSHAPFAYNRDNLFKRYTIRSKQSLCRRYPL